MVKVFKVLFCEISKIITNECLSAIFSVNGIFETKSFRVSFEKKIISMC
jgi:hypothetical protein